MVVWLFLIVSSAGFFILVFCFYLGVTSTNWPITSARIISSNLLEQKNNASSSDVIYYKPKIVYEYEVSAVKHVCKTVNSRLFAYTQKSQADEIMLKYPSNKLVTVSYHPIFNSYSFLQPGLQQKSFYLTLIIVTLLPIVSIFGGYVSGNANWLIELVFRLVDTLA